MTNLRPDEIFFNKHTRKEQPLSSSQQVVYNWFIKNHQEKTVARNAMTDLDACKNLNGLKPETIEKDKRWTKDKRTEIERDKTERSELLEFVAEYFEVAKMLESSYFKKASLYDDWSNGVDYIAGFANDSDKPALKLAVDLTSAEENYRTLSKIHEITNDVANRKLSTIKYFRNEDFKEAGPFYKVPKVVLTIKDATLDTLCNIIVTSNHDKKIIAERLARLKLKENILKDSISQLEDQISVAQKTKKHYYEAAERRAYDEIISIIEAVKVKLESALALYLENLKEKEKEPGL